MLGIPRLHSADMISKMCGLAVLIIKIVPCT